MPTLAEWDGSDGKNVDMKKHKLLLFMMFILFILFFFCISHSNVGFSPPKGFGPGNKTEIHA